MPEPIDPRIEIATDERVFLTGRTRSGKTFLARNLLAPIERLIMLDPKGTLADWRLDPWDRESRRLLDHGEPVRARVALPPTAEDDEDFWNEVLFACWNAGNVTVYVDEVYLLKPMDHGTYPSYLSRVYTGGGERGIGAWATAQRPTLIPLTLMTEATHVFAFRLLREDDRVTLAKNTHPAMEEDIPSEYPHGFRYFNIDQDAPLFVPQYDAGRGEGWGDLGNLVPEEKELEA